MCAFTYLMFLIFKIFGLSVKYSILIVFGVCYRRRCVGNVEVLMQVLVGTVGSVDSRPSRD